MTYYVGVDVGLRSSSLCIVDELGDVCLERTVASEIEAIADVVRGFTAWVEGVALETGNLAPWLAAGLRAVSSPACRPDARQTGRQTDRTPDRPDARQTGRPMSGIFVEFRLPPPEPPFAKLLP